LTNEAYQAIQLASSAPPPIRCYQWKRYGSTNVTFKGCLIDRAGKSIGYFTLVIDSDPTTLLEADPGEPDDLEDDPFPIMNAVGAIGTLSGPVLCNTGRDPTDNTNVIDLDNGAWVEPANERYAIGLVPF